MSKETVLIYKVEGSGSPVGQHVCAFGDDLQGAFGGDFYFDSAGSHIWRCLQTIWWNSRTSVLMVNNASGDNESGAWTQIS